MTLLGQKHTAFAALAALAIHRHTDKIRARVGAAVAKTKDPALQKCFDEKYRVSSEW